MLALAGILGRLAVTSSVESRANNHTWPVLEPAPRSGFLDAIRLIAIVRVLAFHVLGWEWLTTIAVVPLLFFVGGATFEMSAIRQRPVSVATHRFRRVAIPAAIYGVVCWIVLIADGAFWQLGWYARVSLVVPFIAPLGVNAAGPHSLLWTHLWFLGLYGIVVFLSPMLFRLVRVNSAAAAGGAVVWWGFGVALASSTRFQPWQFANASITAADVGFAVSSATIAVAFWLIGLVVGPSLISDSHPRAMLDARWLVPAVPFGVAAALVILREGRGAPIEAGLLAAASFAVVMAARAPLNRVGEWVRSTVLGAWVIRRAFTIYLWQMLVIYAARSVSEHSLAFDRSPFVPIAVFVLLFFPVVAAAGRFERGPIRARKQSAIIR